MSDVKPQYHVVSFVIPTLREYAFGESLDYLIAHLGHLAGHQLELVVVDDSDDDGRAALSVTIDERRSCLPPRVSIRVLGGPRLGKGAAVRLGALETRGDAVFLMDADIPVIPGYIDVFLEHLAAGADLVIGQRDAGRYAGRPLRQILARGLYALQTICVFHERLFSDTQCGFKAFRGDLLRELASLQSTKGGMYDLEYLYAARRRRLRIDQVPVELRGEVRPTRIKLFRCIAIDPLEIFYFKGRGMLGHYEPQS